MILFTRDGRIKTALAILVPLVVAVAILLFAPWKKSDPSNAAEDSPSGPAAIITPEESVSPPPPPPVAVNEMPRSAVTQTPPPAVPQPLPEIVETVPQAPAPEPADAPADPTSVISPPPVPALEEEELVAAIPADSKPLPVETPQPPPVPQAEMTPVPEESPAPELEPAPAPQAAELVHTVARGDTLADISRSYQVGIPEIQKANGMSNDVILPGQQLKIPGGIAPAVDPPEQVEAAPRFHTVVRGDTLGRIARKYSVDTRAIMQANGMKNDVVRLGRKLVIPPP